MLGWVNRDTLVVLSFALYFVPVYAISRILLLLTGSWRLLAPVVALVHALCLGLMLLIEPVLETWVAGKLGLIYGISLTNGFAVDMQICLLVLDYVQNWRVMHGPDFAGVFPRRAYVSLVAALSLLFALAFGYAHARYSAVPVAFDRDLGPELDRRITLLLETDPQTASLAAALEATFPGDFSRIVHAYDATVEPLVGQPAKFADALSWLPKRFLKDVALVANAHTADVVAAPSASLHAVAVARFEMVAVYRDIPLACAALATGSTAAARRDPSWNAVAPVAEQRAVEHLLVATLYAAGAGRDHPLLRDTTKPDPQSLAALRARLRALASPAVLAIMADPDRLKAAPVAEQCQAVYALRKAIADLPEAQSAQMLAYQIALGTPAH